MEKILYRKMLSQQQRLTVLSILIITPIGFMSKFYSGPGYYWVNNSLGGVFYEIFWCLVFLFILPKARPAIIASIVFIVTCILEFMQLWHPPFLEYLRQFFIGRTILGTSFTWWDFPYYVVGSAIGWLWMGGILRSGTKVTIREKQDTFKNVKDE